MARRSHWGADCTSGILARICPQHIELLSYKLSTQPSSCVRLTVPAPPPMASLRTIQRPMRGRCGNFPTNHLPAAVTRANYSPNICLCYLWSHCKHHMSFIKLYSRLFTPLGLQVFPCPVWRALTVFTAAARGGWWCQDWVGREMGWGG